MFINIIKYNQINKLRMLELVTCLDNVKSYLFLSLLVHDWLYSMYMNNEYEVQYLAS